MSKKIKQEKQQKPLRLLPGAIIIALLWLVRILVPIISPDAAPYASLTGVIFGLAVIIWWAFFSRAAKLERLFAILLMIAAIILTPFILHESVAKAGMGMMFPILVIPILSTTFVVWAIATRNLSKSTRRITMVITILLSCAVFALFRLGGIDAFFSQDLSWRWTASPEEQLMAQTGAESIEIQVVDTKMETEPEWPSFRGLNRDGIVRGIKIKTDWTTTPPEVLWRRPVGPGWSSFAVHGDVFFTQEQRGDDEAVTCYSITSGKPIWIHTDKARFWESNGGAGPRGTPTLSGGHVYTLGGTGIVNALDASDGSVIWSRNAGKDTDTKVPIWAFSGSPLVLDNLIIIAAAGSLIAYDRATGEPRWNVNQEGTECYSSPHLAVISDIPQILLQNTKGVFSFAPEDGTLLWSHEWPGASIVQPALIADGDLLVSTGERTGIRRLAVALSDEGWTIEERWTSVRLKPYFNDSAILGDHVYGFDGPSLACITLEDGSRKWKGGRYGRGQFITLADQELLIVISEKGDLALVKADPDQFNEIARIPAIKGKTWNHPVLVGDILLVRNAAEMAAFRLTMADK